MDTMYECFYLAMLIGAILLGVVTAILTKRQGKLWGYIFSGLATITICSFISFFVTVTISLQ